MRCCRLTGLSQDACASSSSIRYIEAGDHKLTEQKACRSTRLAQSNTLRYWHGQVQNRRINSRLAERRSRRIRASNDTKDAAEIGLTAGKVIALYVPSSYSLDVLSFISPCIENAKLTIHTSLRQACDSQGRSDWQQHVLFCGVGLGLASVHRVTLAILAVPFQVLYYS